METLSAVNYEKSLLGYVIENGKHIDLVTKYLTADDFYDIKNKIIYNALCKLEENNIEIEFVTLINQLKRDKVLDKVSQDYIVELMGSPALKSNLTQYAIEINNMANLRQVKKSLVDIMEGELKKGDISLASILSKIENDILRISENSKEKITIRSSQQIVDTTVDILEKKASGEYIPGIESQFKALDEITSGFQKGDLIILASRPSMGKTAFSLNLAANIARSKKVVFFSLEMPAEQLINRILSLRTGIDSQKFAQPKFISSSDWDKIYHYQKEIGKYNLFIDDSAGLKLSELVLKVRSLARTNNEPDVIIIDYMQLIEVSGKTNSGDNRQQEVAAISRALKQLARELNIPIIALAQLSRRVEQRENKKPIMSDLRESGSIEQDADLIMLLYRESYYNPEAKDGSNSGMESVELIISKHRNGQTGSIELIFKPTLGRFSSKERESESKIH